MWRTSGTPTGLLTDLYHPDSAYISWRTGNNGLVTFDLLTRSAPFGGSYLLVAGLELALDFVRSFRFRDEDLAYLARIRDYDRAFLDELRRLHFTGEILAMPEGSVAFPNEPLLRVTAPFREALLLESGLLHTLSVSTLIATKASRIVHAARGRSVAEFAFRRAHEPFLVARSASIGGCTSTSFLAGAKEFNLRATGTIPHALVQLFDSEREAFQAVAESFNRYTLLLDTYDVYQAITTAVEVAREAQRSLGHTLAAVRLDSGDLVGDSIHVRRVLDEAGFGTVRILASDDLDEFAIDELLRRGARIDSFGVGTRLGVGAGDAERGIPGGALGAVYKEVWYDDGDDDHAAKIKLAGEKTTWPGRKEVYRVGNFVEDVVQLETEPEPPQGIRLLRPVMRGGEALPGSQPPHSEILELAQSNLRALPEEWHALIAERPYPVRFSEALQALRRDVMARHAAQGRQAAGIAPD